MVIAADNDESVRAELRDGIQRRDSVTLQGVSTQQFQQIIQEGHLLLH